ncbi:hypothetical protein RHSIM_Rhsim08G0203400 [Rhododendron simsii]|uniref:Uncharacterized protein n=1 Tax=Rhododendron simsii TaxID=118357 RepID=A0A834LGU3_RHOSS|nr:hypothetical protein RHSIM_Rhsim08G0203400 [Rhododendron simsii]
MKTPMSKAFLVLLFAFLGSDARVVPEIQLDILIQFVPTVSSLPSSPPSQEITPTDDYRRHGRPQPPSPMSPSGLSPIKEVLPRPLLNAKTTTYRRPSNPPPPSPREAPPTDEVSVTMTDCVWAASTGLGLEISTPNPSLAST